MSWQLLLNPPNRWVLTLVVVTSMLTGGIAYYGLSLFGRGDTSSNAIEATPPRVQHAVALGYLEPQTEVINVSVPASLASDRVDQLLVQRGDRIQAGDIIAILASHHRLERMLAEASQQVSVAEAELAQVKAGARSGEIAAQQAEIVRLQAELEGERLQLQATLARLQSDVDLAHTEFDRYRSLYDMGAISASEFDQRQMTLETAQARLDEAQANQNRTTEVLRAQIQTARATLDRIADVRPVDVHAAQTKVDQAIAMVQRVEAELAQSLVRSPISGQILEVYTQPGEVVASNGIVSLGQTEHMQVVAEVYQSDIENVRKGQSASITGEGFSGELHGIVHEIGLEVSRQNVFSNQPGENLDQRVVNVRILLNPDESQRVTGLTNLQVQVAISLDSHSAKAYAVE